MMFDVMLTYDKDNMSWWATAHPSDEYDISEKVLWEVEGSKGLSLEDAKAEAVRVLSEKVGAPLYFSEKPVNENDQYVDWQETVEQPTTVISRKERDMSKKTTTQTLTIEVTRSWDDETGKWWHTAALADNDNPFAMPLAESGSCETAREAVIDLLGTLLMSMNSKELHQSHTNDDEEQA